MQTPTLQLEIRTNSRTNDQECSIAPYPWSYRHSRV